MRALLTIEDPEGAAAPWQAGEYITVEVVETPGNLDYLVETRETVPPDIRERHQAELDAMRKAHDDEVLALQARAGLTAATGGTEPTS